MSREGKLLRGEAYHKMRDIDGNYPKGVSENKHKMADLNEYLDSKKAREEEETKKKGGK